MLDVEQLDQFFFTTFPANFLVPTKSLFFNENPIDFRNKSLLSRSPT